MIVGFKGEASKLKSLYKELDLTEVKPNNFDELISAIKENQGKTVFCNYNEIMVFENPTADLVEKRLTVLNLVRKSQHNVYLSLTKSDPSLDKLKLDVSVCTSLKTDDMKLIEDIFNFCNTDLPYNGKLGDDECAVKLFNENRATAKKIADVKKIVKG